MSEGTILERCPEVPTSLAGLRLMELFRAVAGLDAKKGLTVHSVLGDIHFIHNLPCEAAVNHSPITPN